MLHGGEFKKVICTELERAHTISFLELRTINCELRAVFPSMYNFLVLVMTDTKAMASTNNGVE